MEWQKYPILRLVMPMIIGMTVAFFLYESLGYQPFIILPLLIGLASGTVYAHIRNHKRAFVILSSLTFLTFGYELTSRSIHNAHEEYGEKWTYELYKHNPFAIDKAHEVQKRLHDTYIEHNVTGEAGNVVEAMTIGWKKGLTKETKDVFSKAGLSHTLALSGFHITIVFLLLHYVFLGKIVTHRWRIICNILTVGSLWAYAFMAGMQPSLVRATIMCSIFVFTRSFGRRVTALNSCLLTGLIMVIIEPLILFHVGFQLSFSAVIGICALGDTLCKRTSIRLPRERTQVPLIRQLGVKIFNGTKDIVIISLVCNIFTIPIVAYTFHQIPLFSIISNLAATLLVSFLIVTSAVWWLTIWSATLSSIVQAILMWTASTVCGIAHTIASIPYSVYYCEPSLTECFLMYGVVITMTLAIRKHTPHRVMAFLTMVIAFCMVAIIRKMAAPL